jgi:hypothetical protein
LFENALATAQVTLLMARKSYEIRDVHDSIARHASFRRHADYQRARKVRNYSRNCARQLTQKILSDLHTNLNRQIAGITR